jgi:putative Mg2+ transporter-C (MgtC) family protein
MTMPLELLARVVVGTALGGIIGWERDMHGRPAGLRTHMIVGLASTTFAIVSTHFVYFQGYAAGDLVTVDPSRIAASVVTGIGFLGGGAILRTGIGVQGLTTAAGMWLVGSIGLAAGAGMYALSALSTALGVVALTVLRRFEHKDDAVLRCRISLTLTEQAPALSDLLGALDERGVRASATEYEKHLGERRVRVTLEAWVPAGEREHLIEIFETLPGIERVRIEPLG